MPLSDERTVSRELLTADLSVAAAFLKGVIQGTPECIKIVARDGRLLHMNEAGLDMIGAGDFPQVCDADTFSLIAPEDRDAWKVMHERVCGGEQLTWAFDIVTLDGQRRHMETHASPLTLPSGDVAQLAVTRDITERRIAEEQQKLLINELNHRVKNTLAVVQALAMSSLRGECEPSTLRTFEGRLGAMAAAHDVLTERSWTDAPLRRIVERALAPYEGLGKVSIDGPEMSLPPELALTLGMVIHELATNAAKYGALSVSGGAVSVSWSCLETSCELEWVESGGPEVTPPDRKGFGSTLIARSVRQRDAVEIDYRREGVRCRLRFRARGDPVAGEDPQ